ncbi:hypothetical protein QWY82_10205 [Simiduia curdlanivorans]|uniref:DUF4239 domain-containing protein n=1 Tax=Simiduia curdlanivorans TaxID=1492769 RepID=A0ABV8UZ35_9GAMM|nr:hypothetical protein [Simiduia curdlanivorans]MDN3639182.1 hypothetical protein [Simiduia curdlanivorans]
MQLQELFDSLAIEGVLAVIALAAVIASEAGFRHGRWLQARSPEEKEGPTSMIVGSLLALMGFLLAIAMGMASDRFDTRRGLVVAQANSVSTTYLRAGYLPEPASTQVREMLRDYAPQLIIKNDMSDIKSKLARADELHAELWAVTESLARELPNSDMLALFIVSLNETIDLHTTRLIAGRDARVPSTVIFFLLMGSMLTLGMVGYNAGLTRRRSTLTSAILIVVLSAVITMVIDLDRPRDGFLVLNQQALIDLQQFVGATNK